VSGGVVGGVADALVVGSSDTAVHSSSARPEARVSSASRTKVSRMICSSVAPGRVWPTMPYISVPWTAGAPSTGPTESRCAFPPAAACASAPRTWGRVKEKSVRQRPADLDGGAARRRRMRR
jgi:hypothetical protein